MSGLGHYLIVNKMFERFKMANRLFKDQKDIFAPEIQNQNHYYMRKILLTLSLALIASLGLKAQVTTSSLSGIVTDSKGEGLVGATVVATHTPSGTTYGTAARNDGRFTIPGMRVGGPYTIKVSFVGYKEQVFQDVYLSLGVAANINAKLVDESTQLEEIIVPVQRMIFSVQIALVLLLHSAEITLTVFLPLAER